MTGRPLLLTLPVRRWECAGCTQTHISREARPHTPFHTCRNGLATPFVPEGERRLVVTHEREDYIAGDDVQLDVDGRPVMSTTVERPDGVDCTVYAPTATAAAQ